MDIVPIGPSNVRLIFPEDDQVDYNDGGWTRVVLMVNVGDKITRIIGKVNYRAHAAVAKSQLEYIQDKGLTIKTARKSGGELIYEKFRDATIHVTALGYFNLQCLLGEEALTYIPVNWAKETVIQLLDETGYTLLYSNAAQNIGMKGRVSLVDGDFDMNAFLTPLFGLVNLAKDFQRYFEDPDKPGTVPLKFYRTTELDALSAADKTARSEAQGVIAQNVIAALGGVDEDHKKPDRAVMYAMQYMHIFMMVKTGEAVNVKKALEKRLSAMRFSMGLEDLEVEKFVVNKFHMPSYKRAYDRLTFYPKLKSVIFSNILVNNDPFNDHIRLILKEAQFTNFNFIAVFVGANELTVLHTLNEVAGEYTTFMESWTQLKHRYGDAWAYCKLVNPTETLGTISKFPNLSKAAKAYAFVTCNPETIKNIQGMRSIPAYYFQYAKTPLTGVNETRVGSAADVRAKLQILQPGKVFEQLTDELLDAAVKVAQQAQIPPEVARYLSGRTDQNE